MSDPAVARAACAAPCMDRRALLSYAVLAAAGAALAACGAADATAPATLSPLSIKVADYPALSAVGGIALLDDAGSPIAVVRTADTNFVALSRICPHRGATIGSSGTGFECPRHHSRYDLSGTWVGGENTTSMRNYPAVFDAATGTLTVG